MTKTEPRFTIENDTLYENGRKVDSKSMFYCKSRSKPEEHRDNHLCSIAFRDGLDVLERCFQVDREGLPDDVVVLEPGKVIAEFEITNYLKEHLEQLQDGWFTCTAHKEPKLFWTLDSLWQAGLILMGMRTKSPQFWFKKIGELAHAYTPRRKPAH